MQVTAQKDQSTFPSEETAQFLSGCKAKFRTNYEESTAISLLLGENSESSHAEVMKKIIK
jgi:hypothetical protein